MSDISKVFNSNRVENAQSCANPSDTSGFSANGVDLADFPFEPGCDLFCITQHFWQF